MATEVFRTVRPSGGDYTSLAACEAGEQQNWVTADEYGVWEIQGDWSGGPDATCQIDGSTTDTTRYIEIRADASNRYDGTWSTSKYIIASAASSVVRIQDANVRIIGIQSAPNGVTAGFLALSGGSATQITDCAVNGQDSTTSGFLCTTSSTAEITCRNCVAYNCNTRGFGITVANGDMICYNCTANDCVVGFGQTAGLLLARNCLAQNNTTADYSGTFDAASNYNCDEDATAPGANSFTDTASFTNAAGGDFHLTTALSQQGEDLSGVGVTTDFEGDARSNWDVGADEIAAAPPATTVPRRALMGVGF